MSSRCFDFVNVPVTELTVKETFRPSTVKEFNPTVAIFTSPFGADIVLEGGSLETYANSRVIAIGKRTASALEGKFGSVTVPEDQSSLGVISLLERLLVPEDRVVLFISSRSNGMISRYLQEKGITALVEELYHAEKLPADEFKKAISDNDCFGLIVTSSFEAEVIFSDMLDYSEKQEILRKRRVFAIGRTTASTLHGLNIPVSEPVGKSDLPKLVEAIDEKYCASE